MSSALKLVQDASQRNSADSRDESPEAVVRFRGGGFDPRPNAWIGWAAVSGLVAVWQLAAASGFLSQARFRSEGHFSRWRQPTIS